MKLILQCEQWPPEKSLLGAINAPEVASRHTDFQNFLYPALSLTRLPFDYSSKIVPNLLYYFLMLLGLNLKCH